MNILLFAVLAITNSLIASDPRKTSQTFMFTRPIEQNIGATTFIWDDVIAQEERGEIALRILPMFQKSITNCKTTYTSRSIANQRYVLQAMLLIMPKTATFVLKWFGLPSSYQALFTLEPHQKQWGIMPTVNYHLKNLGWAFLEHSWIEVSMPFVKVTNSLDINQNQAMLAGKPTSPEILLNAFNNPTFGFAAISNHKQCTFGVAELRCIYRYHYD